MSKRVYCIASFEAKDGLNEELFKVLQSLEPTNYKRRWLYSIYCYKTYNSSKCNWKKLSNSI